jgi:hypothetical protein
MVEKLKKVLAELNLNHKQLWLFAMLKMDEIVDKWSLIVSAPWISDDSRSNDFEYIIGLLKKELTGEELSTIARLVLLDKDDHLVEELLKKNTGDSVKEEAVNGNVVHDGIIIESNKDLVWQSENLPKEEPPKS